MKPVPQLDWPKDLYATSWKNTGCGDFRNDLRSKKKLLISCVTVSFVIISFLLV